MSSKYKVKLSDLERQGGVQKFERDGIRRAEFMRVLHKETEGMKRDEKSEFVERLFDRREEC